MKGSISSTAPCAVVLLAALAAASIAVASPADEAVFNGPIDASTVQAFMTRYQGRSIRRVVVESPGGDVLQAIELANWMLDHEVDVEVAGACASSCANYLFAAGRHRVIDDGGIVIWHGSALQRDFRDRAGDCRRRLAELERGGGELLERDRDALADEQARCAYHAMLQQRQDAFFARIDGSEYITRMGQEPRNFRALWTVPVAVMARLGYRDVEAPAAYASPDYMRRFNGPHDTEPILSLGFGETGAVVETAPGDAR